MADESHGGVSTYKLRSFTEADQVNCILNSISIDCESLQKTERALQDLREILDRYQEQPHLLDPHLDSFISQLLIPAQDSSNTIASSQAFKYLYLFTKVRGHKYIVRLFPHEVKDVESVLALLQKQNPSDHRTWEARYILLLWLSIVCMVPFDMTKFDGGKFADKDCKSITERIIDVAKVYLNVADKCQDAAALVIAKFVTRPDVKKHYLPEFLSWCLKDLPLIDGTSQNGINLMTGILSTLALVFKHGKREDLKLHARSVHEVINACDILKMKNSLLRKLYIKLIQRLGLTFLKPRLASWRYQRGTRSLIHNLVKSDQFGTVITEKQNFPTMDDEYEQTIDVLEDVEEIIGTLLAGLKEIDTIVRWSAAKGVGRITGRLPKDLADDVTTAVLELFSPLESHCAWHGGCLALAELGRRGLLLPRRLPEVIPVVTKALLYDEKIGAISVGSNVRDSACYVCWSFARAYDPTEIKPYVEDIARALMIATLFDRDINCRRAASAAFQENVGRQGTLPHGIDILTKTDYYEVGKRKNAYLNLSVYVSQYKEYRESLIDHLYKIKLGHWDIAIRELVSKALFNLTPQDPLVMTRKVLPSILQQILDFDIHVRHGSILCAAELTHALYGYALNSNRTLMDILGHDCHYELESIISKLTDSKFFRGQGGELLRPAACFFIQKISLSKFKCTNPQTVGIWRNTIDENINGSQRTTQEKAVAALRHFTENFYQLQDGTADENAQESLISTYVEKLKHSSGTTREGFSLALGVLPRFMLKGCLLKVLDALLQVSEIVEKDPGKFAQSRADALHSLASILQTVGIAKNGDANHVVNETTLARLYECCFNSMKDYTIDSRGDVGSWCRKAAMTCLLKLTLLVVQTNPELLTKETCARMMCYLLKQCCEKIDDTRAHAGHVMLTLIHNETPKIPHISEHKLLCDIFPREDCENLNWSAAGEVFQKISKLLDIPCYQYFILSGIILSAGGLSESLIRQGRQSLENFLERLTTGKHDARLVIFAENILELFKEYEKNDRVIIPLFKVLDHLLSIGSLAFLSQTESNHIPEKIFELTQSEITKISDARKIIISINVFSGLLQFPGNARQRALKRLLIFLCHKYPRVRKTAADSLYMALITYDDIIDDDKQDEVFQILSETQWEDDDINDIRAQRNNLCHLLDITVPVMKFTSKGKAKKDSSANNDPLSSYKDLVSRVDY